MSRLKILFLAALLVGAVSCSRDPEVVKRKYIELGNKYFNNGKYKEAHIMYRNSLRKDMRFGEAYYRLGLAEMRMQRFQDAVRSFRRAAELDPKNVDAHRQLANLYLAAYTTDRRRPKQVLGELKEIGDALLKLDPKSFEGLRVLGYWNLLSGNFKDAAANFQAADQVKPLEPDVVMPLVQAMIADNRFPEAEKLAQALIAKNKTYAPIYDVLYLQYLRQKQGQAAETILKAKCDNIPKQPAFLLQLAGHYYGMGRRPDMLKVLQRILDNPKDFDKGRLLVGEFYFRIREFNQAIEQYQQGEQLGDKDKATYRKRAAEAFVYAGRRTEAVQMVESVLKENPQDPEALAMRASLTLMTGNRDKIQAAINDLQVAVRAVPQNPVLRYEMGRAHLAKGDVDQARIQFQEAIKLRPDYLPPRFALVQIHLARSEFARAKEAVEQILQIDPANSNAKLLRASAMLGLGERNQARALLTEHLKTDPNSRDARFQLAMVDLADRQYKAAEAAFRALTQLKPPDIRGSMGLIEVQFAQKNYDAALKLVAEERAKHPDRVELSFAAASIASRAEKYDVAEAEYKKLAEKYPQRADVFLRLGEVYRVTGRSQLAADSFRKAKDLDPNGVSPRLYLAMLLDAEGQPQQARPVYEEILKMQPDNAIALNNLAYILAETGADLDHALTLATRAKQRAPNDPNISDTLGWIYIKKNLSDSAIQIFQELVRQNPSHPTWRFHLAMALFQKGDKPSAKRELETALKNKPGKRDEGRIKELLARIG